MRKQIDVTGSQVGYSVDQLRHLATWRVFGEVMFEHLIETAEKDEIPDLFAALERWQAITDRQANRLLEDIQGAFLDGSYIPEDAEPAGRSDPKENLPWARLLLAAIDPEFRFA